MFSKPLTMAALVGSAAAGSIYKTDDMTAVSAKLKMDAMAALVGSTAGTI